MSSLSQSLLIMPAIPHCLDRGVFWSKEDFPLVEKHRVRKDINKLDTQKCTGDDGMTMRAEGAD